MVRQDLQFRKELRLSESFSTTSSFHSTFANIYNGLPLQTQTLYTNPKSRPASKLEIQQVIEDETRKAALQASTFLSIVFKY